MAWRWAAGVWTVSTSTTGGGHLKDLPHSFIACIALTNPLWPGLTCLPLTSGSDCFPGGGGVPCALWVLSNMAGLHPLNATPPKLGQPNTSSDIA